MVLNIEKKVTETIEIETPSYHKSWYNHYFKVGDNSLITVANNLVLVTNPESDSLSKNIVEALKYEKITEAEFIEKYEEITSFIKSLVYELVNH